VKISCIFAVVINKHCTNIMENSKHTFTEWWKTLSPAERDETAIELSQKCNTALNTVLVWGLGYRKPKARSQDIIVSYFQTKGIRTDSKTLFPA